MTVRTCVLAVGSTGTANVTTTCYTCPTGKTAIVKTAHLSNGSGSTTQTIVAAQSGAVFVNLRLVSIATGQHEQLDELYLVLEPGQSFVINANQTDAIKYWLSGVELEGTAP